MLLQNGKFHIESSCISKCVDVYVKCAVHIYSNEELHAHIHQISSRTHMGREGARVCQKEIKQQIAILLVALSYIFDIMSL